MNRQIPVTGKRALITGGAKGIGAAVAAELARRGAKVSLVGLEPDALEQHAKELGPDHTWFEADVRSQEQLDAAAAHTVQALGGIDIVLANAGIARTGTIRTTDADTFAQTVDINLNGVYRTARATLGGLTDSRGYLLIIASMASFAPMPGSASYGASKAGAESLAASLRLELAGDGIAVGSVHPSWIDTDIVRGPERDTPVFAKMRADMPWPLNKTHAVEECALAIVEGMERRAKRVYVPKGARVGSYASPLLKSGSLQRRLIRRLGRDLQQLDIETRALEGR